MYNIAMIEQKAAELLLSVPPAKRSLNELQRAIEQASHAQKFVSSFSLQLTSHLTYWRFRLFQSLAADRSHQLPYSTDIADQRRKYGESVLRRCDDHLTTQRQYENETQTKLDEARRKRQEEKEKQDVLEASIEMGIWMG
jgi:RNA polymerase-associated protein CTR9